MTRRNKLFALVLLYIGVLVLAYVGFVTYRGVRLYTYLKAKERGWHGDVHQPDPRLGYAPIPGAQGAHVFPVGLDLGMRYDRQGFRVPVDQLERRPRSRPLILTLGGSFTYGDATPAEQTYPHLVASGLGGTELNAGVPGYGLAQMMLLAQSLIPRHRPDFVLVQYSPWLAERAISGFAPTYTGRLPTPYFFEREGQFELHEPSFMTNIFDRPIWQYRDGEAGLAEASRFIVRTAGPMILEEDWNLTHHHVKRFLGFTPRPSANAEAVVEAVYEEISRVAQKNGAEVLIVVIGRTPEAVTVPAGLEELGQVVDAHGAMLSRLPERDLDSYREVFGHWRGSPPTLVDGHPNPVAHQIIADSLLRAIGSKTASAEHQIPSD